MHGMRLLFAITLLSSGALTLLSIVFYLPWFRQQIRLRDPLEFERTGSWTFPGPSIAPRACLYFLQREYRRSFDPTIRRHGDILRWVFSFPLMLATLTLVIALITGTWLR